MRAIKLGTILCAIALGLLLPAGASAAEPKDGAGGRNSFPVTASETPSGLPEGGATVTSAGLGRTSSGATIALSDAATSSISASYPSGCVNVDAWRNMYTTLGALAYRWHQTKYFCWSNNAVTSISIGYYVSDNNGFNTFLGISGSDEYFYTWNGNSHGAHTSMRQAAMQNCFWQCLGTAYPWVRINVFSNGTYTYSVGG